MATLRKYPYVVAPTGLVNLGNTCFLNALVQALISCPSFNAWCVKHAAISDLVHAFAETYAQMASAQPNMLLNISDLANEIGGGDITIGRQEDAEQCFQRIVKLISTSTKLAYTEPLPSNRKFKSIFAVRYSCLLTCSACPAERHIPLDTCTTQPWLDMPTTGVYGDAKYEREITNDSQFLEYIMGYRLMPRDCKCESCGSRNTTTQHFKLQRISAICIVIFKKYHVKRVQHFPQSFSIPGVDGEMMYDVVAAIEQSGSMSSGHYWCVGRRLQVDMQQAAHAKLRKKIASAAIGSNEMAQLNDQMEQLELEQRRATAAYMLNDGHVSRVAGIVPSAETYMVMYARRV